jgi:hypothetical protein
MNSLWPFFLIIAILILGWVIFFGMKALIRGLAGEASAEWKGIKLNGPVGFVLVALGAFLIWACLSLYNPILEKDIVRLTAEKKDTEEKLTKTQADLEGTKKDLASTQQSFEDEKKQVKDLTYKNDALTRKLAEAEAQVRDTEGQARAVVRTIARLKLSEQQQREFDKLDTAIEELNQHLTRLRVEIVYLPTIEGRNAVAAFEIYQQAFEKDQTSARGAGLFDFDSTEYKVLLISGNQEGIPAQLENEIIRSICEAASTAALSENNITPEEAASRIPSLTGYDLNRPVIAVLTEAAYVMMRLKLMAAEALVLVRGYADGEMAPWSHPADNSFTSIKVHENMTPDAPENNGGLNFRRELTSVSIGQEQNGHRSYTNVDLPNLRAEEVAKMLAALVRCPQSMGNPSIGNPAVEILQGRVYPEHNKSDRRVRVNLLVFLKES